MTNEGQMHLGEELQSCGDSSCHAPEKPSSSCARGALPQFSQVSPRAHLLSPGYVQPLQVAGSIWTLFPYARWGEVYM